MTLTKKLLNAPLKKLYTLYGYIALEYERH